MEEKTMEEKVGKAQIYMGGIASEDPEIISKGIVLVIRGESHGAMFPCQGIESIADIICARMEKYGISEYQIISGELVGREGKIIKTLPVPESEIETLRKALEERLSE